MLNREKLSSLLPDTEVVVFDITDSTNTQANLLARSHGGNILVAANAQTNGKGRQGKSFYSPAQSGVYFSVVLRPNGELGDVVSITSAAAVAVSETIEEMTDLNPQIKWVNDIYIGGKKVCGILAQSIIESGKICGVVVGIGVNVSTSVFPDGLGTTAGSLNTDIDKNAFVARVAEKLFTFSRNTSDKTYLDYYRKKSCVIGRKIKFFISNTEHHGEAVGIDDNANLLVRENGEIVRLTGGEITLRLDE